MLSRVLLLLPELGVLARTTAALRAFLENKGPIGKTLAATMPAFCSRLVNHVSWRAPLHNSGAWYILTLP
jgi:hypothetical protein